MNLNLLSILFISLIFSSCRGQESEICDCNIYLGGSIIIEYVDCDKFIVSYASKMRDFEDSFRIFKKGADTITVLDSIYYFTIEDSLVKFFSFKKESQGSSTFLSPRFSVKDLKDSISVTSWRYKIIKVHDDLVDYELDYRFGYLPKTSCLTYKCLKEKLDNLGVGNKFSGQIYFGHWFRAKEGIHLTDQSNFKYFGPCKNVKKIE